MEEPLAGVRDLGGLLNRLYSYARHDIQGVWKGGWRPALGFMGVYIAHFAYVVAPKAGIVMDYTSVNVFLGLVFLQALGRGLEKHMAGRIPAAG